MPSKVDIANVALRKLGGEAIASFTDGTPNANKVANLYDAKRQDLLRNHAWNFATKRAKLAQLASTPASGFDHDYQPPADWLRTVRVYDNDTGTGTVAYKEEDGVIRSSADELWITYVYDVDDPNRMTADFRELLATALAADLAVAIANSNSLADRLEVQLPSKERRARKNDAHGDAPDRLPVGSWVSRRYRSGSNASGSFAD